MLVITICLLATIIGYNIITSDYPKVNAKIIEVGTENNQHNSNVNDYLVLEYEYNKTITQGKIYVSSFTKYKENDIVEVKINPKKPTSIMNDSIYMYLVPFLVIMLIADGLYLKQKISNL